MTPDLNRIYVGDCLDIMRSWPDAFVQTVVTSPPYWGLRDYGVAGQFGLEKSPEAYTAKMVEVFREVRRVLKDDGTLWLNLGDSYASDTKGSGGPSLKQDSNGGSRYESRKMDHGLKSKDLVGIPWRIAFALQADGWYLRSDIIWAKPNPMPESVTDRPTRAHEYLFLMSKSERYFYDAESIKEPAIYGSPNSPESIKSPYGQGFTRHAEDYSEGAGRNDGGRHVSDGFLKKLPEGQVNIRWARDKQRGHSRRHAGFNDRWDNMEKKEQCSGMRNKRSVWNVSTCPFPDAHFATFPQELINPCILAGCPPRGLVLDPFMGAGTTALVAAAYGRQFIGCEMNPVYVEIAEKRIALEKSQMKMAI